jgi:polyphosphate kinase
MQQEIKDLLSIQLSDNIKARVLDNDLSNQYINPRNKKKIRSQVEIYNYLYKKRTEQTLPAPVTENI